MSNQPVDSAEPIKPALEPLAQPSKPACHVASPMIALDELAADSFGLVAEIQARDADIARMMAMGVCVGRRVKMVQAGDPLILQVLGTRIGLSARMAKRVLVSACPDDGPVYPAPTVPGGLQ